VRGWLACILGCTLRGAFVAVALMGPQSASAESLDDYFLRVDRVSPAIRFALRYAGPDNATGANLSGYSAGQCWLVPEASKALARVQHDLQAQGVGLVVYDCYRPVRAVKGLLSWATGASAAGRRLPSFGPYHPATKRTTLVQRGYIANRSRHSLGVAVDLGLIAPGGPLPSPPVTDCRLPARVPNPDMDMGTSFDCFDPLSQTHSRDVSTQAQRHRALLLTAMSAQGFRNYAQEWWHYEFVGQLAQQPKPRDLPIQP
jgi:zinc D-Ala-D-Ala dipeptidase